MEMLYPSMFQMFWIHLWLSRVVVLNGYLKSSKRIKIGPKMLKMALYRL
jgi:hypothetical protein